MEYFGRVFRPPSEANSLIVQATIGCSHNKCRFCDMYKEKKFCIRPVKETIKDLKELSNYYPNVRRIFLGDGDALIMKTQDLLKILEEIKTLFPYCERVTCYATPKSILTKTIQDLRELKRNGLKMIYLGVESGSDRVLSFMNKGVDSRDMIKACKMIKEAGIKLSITLISGLGSQSLLTDHALKSAELVSEVNPDYLGLLTLRAEGQAPLVEDIKNEDFILLSPEEILYETKLLLENIDSPGTIFRSNHISNYVELAGTLNKDKEKLIHKIDQALDGYIPVKSEYYRNLDIIKHF